MKKLTQLIFFVFFLAVALPVFGAEIKNTSFEETGVPSGWSNSTLDTNCTRDYDAALPGSPPDGLGDECFESVNENSTNDSALLISDTNQNKTTNKSRIYFYLETEGLGNDEQVLLFGQLGDGAWATRLYIRQDSGSLYPRFAYREDGGYVWPAYTATAILEDTWYYVEIEHDSSAVSYKIWSCDNGIYTSVIDNSYVISGSTNDWDVCYLGLHDQNGGGACRVYIDAYNWDDATQPGRVPEGGATECADTVDNDLDGDTDCADASCAGSSSSTTQDGAFPADERPTGLGDTCDFKVATDGVDGEETNTDPTGATHYVCGYFRITDDSVNDGEEFRIVELRNNTDAAVYGTVEKSGSDLQLKWTYYLGSEITTDAIVITEDTWYYSEIFYKDDGDSDEVEIETWSCDNSIYSELGFDIDLASQTGARAACTDLDYGVDEATFCNLTTTVYADAWNWSSSSMRGTLGIVKQNLTPSPYFATDWKPSQGAEGDVILFEGFNARAYQDNGGAEYDGWVTTDCSGESLNCTVDLNYDVWKAAGPYSGRFAASGVASDPAYAVEAFASSYTHLYTKFWVRVADKGSQDIRVVLAIDSLEATTWDMIVRGGTSKLAFRRWDGVLELVYEHDFVEDTAYLIEVEWKDDSGSGDGIFNVNINGGSIEWEEAVVSSTRNNIKKFLMGIYTDGDESFSIAYDELIIKDGTTHDGWIGDVDQSDLLSDGSDASYFVCDTEADSYGQNEHNCVMSFSNPEHTGTIKELRLFAKAKEYSSLHNRVKFGAYYESDAADKAYNAPEKPTYFASSFEWMMMSWDRDPAMTLKYADDINFENDATVGDLIKGAESNISAYIVGIDKPNDKLTIAKVQIYDSTAWGFDGAGYSFFNGEALDYVAGGTNSTTVASDYDTEDPQEALSWTIADDFLGQVATMPTARWDDDFTDSGGRVSEMFAQVLSTEDSQEVLTHFIGSTAWTETTSPYDGGIGIKGRTSGPAYIEIRYGTTEADVKANTGDTWTTNTSTLTSSSDDYTFQINILEDQTVKTTAGGDHTVDFSSDSLNNAVIYFDIRIKGESASDWYSWYRLEGLGSTDNNPVVQDMTNDLLATKAFPAHNYTGTLWFVQMADDHGIDHPALWAQMETKMNTNSAAFFMHLGDEVPDPGDRLEANRRMWKNFCGFQNKRFTWTRVRTRWPYIKSYSDHDFFVNDATKAGSMQYGKTSLTYLRVYIGLQTNLEWTPFPQTCDVNGANCTYLLAPDYDGNYMTDLTGTASGGDANTLDDTDASRDFNNPSHASWVLPGSAVHNITDNTVGIVSSVTDDDTLEMAWNLQDFDGDTGSTFDASDEYRVARTGTWRGLQWGAVAEFWVTDSRALSDPSSVIGCDFYDGRAYGSASKDSGTTADPPGASDTFKLYESGQNFSSTVHVGDGVIITKNGTDYYAHVSEVTDNANLVLDRDIANTPFGHSYTVHESGGSVHGSHQTNHEAGHIQRTWLEKTIEDSTRLAKFVVSDTNIRHNAARWHDSISDRDGVCYGNSLELAKDADPGCCPVNVNYPRPLATKLDINDDTGWDADNYIKGNTSGARARIKSVSVDTLTFYTEFGGIADSDDKGWGHVIHGEFLVGETVTEYTDYGLITSDATATALAPPSDGEFKADDPATFADYNRFWKASGTREYTMQYLNIFANIFYLVGDRHYHAICDATHSDDFFIQVDASPCGWNYTKGWTGWGIDDDEDGHIQSDEMAFVHEENISASDAGAFALISVNYGTNIVQIDMIKPDGNIWGDADVTNTGVSLSLTVYPSLIWIDEDFEEEGGEEDWLTHLIMNWYADDYWLDKAVGM